MIPAKSAAFRALDLPAWTDNVIIADAEVDVGSLKCVAAAFFLFRIARVFMLSSRPQVQALEGRRLCAATSPLLTTIHVDGSVHGITAVVLGFDESLTPASATNANSYIFGKVPPQNNSNSGITLGDVLGFLSRRATPNLARPAAVRATAWVKLGKIQWRDVTYDDSTHTVTLLPVKVFNGATFFHMLRVKGTGPYALEDVQGHPFSGGADAVLRWQYRVGKTLQYTDKDGDRVTLTLKGPGMLSTFIRRVGEPRPVILISGSNATSKLSGKIIQSPKGNGTTVIEQLSGATVKNNIIGNPHFFVVST